MERNCYVLICQCDSGDGNVTVFYELDNAVNCMNEEAEFDIKNLEAEGYEVRVLDKRNDGIEIYVPHTNIYINYWIEPTTIR